MIAGVLSVFPVFDTFYLHFAPVCDTITKKGGDQLGAF
jgi:hypothetical protein